MEGSIYLLCILVATTAGSHVSFEGHKVWSVTPQNHEALAALFQLEGEDGIDFWKGPSVVNREAHIMIAPEKQIMFEHILSKRNIASKILNENIERDLELERQNQDIGIKKFLKNGFDKNLSLPLDHFWTHDEIHNYIDYLVSKHKDIVSSDIVGRSLEGRNLRVVKISLKGKVTGDRPIVFIDAGTHAREWASHMSAIYLIHQLVERRTDNLDILQNIDWIIVPMVNPDGYAYTHSTNRMWRKNRRILKSCVGVDNNRNYGYRWEKSKGCGITFSGDYPFSEPETRAIRYVHRKYQGSIKLYAALHSYGNYVLYPWGFAETLIGNWEQHEDVGIRFAEAVAAKTQRIYEVGNAAILLYAAAGGSDDYAASVGVDLAYTVEVTGGEKSGFILPVTQIEDVASETFAGLAEFGRYVAERDWNQLEINQTFVMET